MLAGNGGEGADQQCWLVDMLGSQTSSVRANQQCWLVTGVRELASRCCLAAVMTKLTSSIDWLVTEK